MNAVAPTIVPTATAPAAPASSCPRLYEMRPGMLFTVHAHAANCVLAVLSAGCTTVADNSKVWCVVIGAMDGAHCPGEMFSLPRDTRVYRAHIVSPITLVRQ